MDVFGFVASDYFMNRHHQSDGKQNYFNYREVHFRFFSVPQYYKNKIWQEFDAVISGLISKWIFVALQDTAEWFVEIKNWNFDEKNQTMKVKSKKYTLWQDLRVRLVNADEKLLRLDFEIVEK